MGIVESTQKRIYRSKTLTIRKKTHTGQNQSIYPVIEVTVPVSSISPMHHLQVGLCFATSFSVYRCLVCYLCLVNQVFIYLERLFSNQLIRISNLDFCMLPSSDDCNRIFEYAGNLYNQNHQNLKL